MALAQRVTLALLIAAVATAIIAGIEAEQTGAEVSTSQTQQPCDGAVFHEENVPVVVISDTPELATPARVERYAGIREPCILLCLHLGVTP